MIEQMIKKINAFYYYNKNQWASKEWLLSEQNRKLRHIIQHAYQTTWFYRNWFDNAGITPEQIRTTDDLHLIPSVTKTQIQNDHTQFISDRYLPEMCLTRTTSGSSGKILKVLWDQDNCISRIMAFYRTFSMIGYSPFKKVVYFLPATENLGFNFGLFRQMGISLNVSFEEIITTLRRFKPQILSIYPSFAIDLASHLTAEDIDIMGIRAISLNSEMILPHDVAIIEKTFQCPTYDEYSSVEIGLIASMCSKRGMHIFSDNVVLEILDNEGNPLPPGEKGEVVLTTLNSFAMPFIRYRIGDISSVPEETCSCSCGRSFPLLGPVEGRKDDAFIITDGRKIPAWQIYEVIERPIETVGMEKLVLSDFHLVQTAPDLAEFFYVKGPDFHGKYLTEVKDKSQRLFGEDFIFQFTELEDIDRVKRVKRKYIQCDVT